MNQILIKINLNHSTINRRKKSQRKLIKSQVKEQKGKNQSKRFRRYRRDRDRHHVHVPEVIHVHLPGIVQDLDLIQNLVRDIVTCIGIINEVKEKQEEDRLLEIDITMIDVIDIHDLVLEVARDYQVIEEIIDHYRTPGLDHLLGLRLGLLDMIGKFVFYTWA